MTKKPTIPRITAMTAAKVTSRGKCTPITGREMPINTDSISRHIPSGTFTYNTASAIIKAQAV